MNIFIGYDDQRDPFYRLCVCEIHKMNDVYVGSFPAYKVDGFFGLKKVKSF